MMEKRNRNGGSGRNRTDEPDDDLAPAEDDTVALKEPAAPNRKPAVETATARRQGGVTRLILLLLVIATAALVYRYWGFWQSGPATQAAPPAPAVTVAKPVVREMEELSLIHI